MLFRSNKAFICFGNIVDGLYILTPNKHELYNSKLDNDFHVKSLKRKFPSASDIFWVILIQTKFKD